MTLHACNICFEWIFERSIVSIKFNELKLIEWYSAQTSFFSFSNEISITWNDRYWSLVDQFNINRR